jgi:hypothetical protein
MENELLAEYDFTQMKGGVRGKYVERYRAGTNLVLYFAGCPVISKACFLTKGRSDSSSFMKSTGLLFYRTSRCSL